MEEVERTERAASFGAGADAYERSRPAYPQAALDWLLPAGARTILDLGAGTGKLTRQLAARGLGVTAVDPSPGMLAELARVLPGTAALRGTAEAIPCADAAFEAVTVAQAWHWFDTGLAEAEVARVLRPGGSLLLVWNTRDTSVDWVARLARLIDGGRPISVSGEAPRLGPRFRPVEAREFPWRFWLDRAGFRDLAASRSAFFVSGEGERRDVLAEVEALFDEVACRDDPAQRTVALPYRARCFRAQLAA